MTYFERSLEIKRQVLQNEGLQRRIIADYNREYGLGESAGIEFIGLGDNKIVFRVGRLENGLWLAHKIWFDKRRIELNDGRTHWLENECQVAERYFRMRRNVPYFHMVVSYMGLGSVLTEDITEGNTRDISDWDIDRKGVQYAIMKRDGRKVKVYIDFDSTSIFKGFPSKLRYCSPEAILAI